MAHDKPVLSYARTHPRAAHRVTRLLPPTTTGTPSSSAARPSAPPPPVPRFSPRRPSTRSRRDASVGYVLRAGLAGLLGYLSGARTASSSVANRYAHVPSHQRRAGPPPYGADDAAAGARYNLRSTSPTAVAREGRQLRAEAAPAGLSPHEQKVFVRRLRYRARRSSGSLPVSDTEPLHRSLSLRSRDSSGAEPPRSPSGDGARLVSESEATSANTFAALAGCMVCLTRFKDGEDVMQLPCGHRYHEDCIERWLSRKATCPYCRTVLEPHLPAKMDGS